MSEKTHTAIISACLSAFVTCVVAALLWNAIGRNTDFQLEITRPDGTTVKLAVEGGAVDYEAVLTALFQDQFLAPAAREWLATTEDMRSIRDPRLADLLRLEACGHIPPSPLNAHLDSLRACASTPANTTLRRLALEDHGYPFHAVGIATRVSVPEESDWPPRGHASVCSHDLWGRSLELLHGATGKPTFVRATQRISPCSAVGVGTQMHLHPDDARAVFGRQLLGIETLYVVVPNRTD